jgi:hypothetical protein
LMQATLRLMPEPPVPDLDQIAARLAQESQKR